MRLLKQLSVVSLLLLGTSHTLFGQGLFSGGDGSKSNPYQIATEQDLRTLADQVDNSNSFVGKYLKQTADITFSEGTPVLPIGGPLTDGFHRDENRCFQGEYDGGMHKIYNLNIYDSEQLIVEGDEAHMAVGLFGALGPQATIKNVVIASGHIYGFASVGAIAGRITEGCTISRCKVGPDVRISCWSSGGGIAGSSLGKNMKITECVNYANVAVYGQGIHKTAGGIIASSPNTTIIGCANFGDIWAKDGFAGGILGYMPHSTQNFIFDYPELRSCMNAGDVSSMGTNSAGLIGVVAYNLTDDNGPIAHQLISNSYSYGQTMASYTRCFGPICAFHTGNRFPLTVEKTFYNKDRYIVKSDGSADAQLGYSLGEAKTHAECTSPEFITTLNDGGVSLFEADRHHINGTMPILKWINETYDPEIDKPNQYRTDRKSSVYKRRAGSFFPPNRTGDFLIYDMSLLMPNIQAKSFGCNIDRGFIDRVLPIKGGGNYTFFMSSSAFRRQLKEDGMYVDERPNKPADHWLITPSFKVEEGTPWFHWVAASEDGKMPSTYALYIVADPEATTPEKFLATEPIYEVEAEQEIQDMKETINDEERIYCVLHAHKVDLSKYVGKEVRLAFRDRSIDQFHLLIGQMKMGQANGVGSVTSNTATDIAVADQTITATHPDSQLALYSLEGIRLVQAQDQLVYRGYPGVYVLVVSDAAGEVERHKVILY